ncbi:MICAL-like protein 2 isoform X2 [Cyrtonyx montezumae]|uniref:MICAL-like protein 2 isoform X2 n=1 Tax=Cyrtonyx montezumae TaxID=9017 RepID=UPI0032D9E746
MAAIQNLQLWCKQQCEGYRDVSITNMTTSFRDGLAFCAILHRHRPDLINFSSLSKENVYENNKLAFQVASEQLGIPALLDAEDMVALRIPDRLSIITYVSQYYNYFHGRSPIGGMAGIKRSSSELQEQPAGKKAVPEPTKPVSPKLPRAHPPAKAKPKEASPVTTGVLTESGNIRSSCCGICGNHVHLVQRHLVDGKLYHRNCFRCRECWNVLLPGSYKAGPEPGTFICTSHQQPDNVQISGLCSTKNKPESTPAPTTARAFQKAAEPKKQEQVLKKPSQEGLSNSTKPSVSSSGSSGFRSLNTPWSSSAVNKSDDCKGTPLGNKADHHEGTTSGPLWTTSKTKTQQARENFFQSLESSSNKTSDAKKHSPSHSSDKISSGKTVTEVTLVKTEKAQARNHIIRALAGSNTSPSRPGGLSSTGSSASSSSNFSPSSSQWQRPALKAQTSKTDCAAPKQEKITEPLSKSQTAIKPVESVHKPESKGFKGTINVGDDKSESPADWRSRLKPVANKDQAGSKKPIDNSQMGTGSPAQKEKKPSPLVVPSAKQESVKSSIPKSIQGIEAVSPTKLHPDYLPEEEIQKKVRDIEKQLDVLELKGVDLEKQLRDCEGDESEDALMVDWFKLIHEKQLLLRQESELMYKMKQQNLEEQQWNIELELRRLVDKPEELKTRREKEREKELLDSYLNTVNDRNNIVECLDEDRIREQEEDQMLADMIRKLDGSLEGQEQEKKKNKFRLSKIWKQKNKS